MRNEDERLLKEFTAWLKKVDTTQFQSLDAAFEAFLENFLSEEEYDEGMSKATKIDSIYHEIITIPSLEQRGIATYQALQTYPGNLLFQFELEIVRQKIRDPHHFYEVFPRLERMEHYYFKKHQQELLSQGFNTLDHHSYLLMKQQLMLLFIENQLYTEADKHARELLQIDPSDHLGVSIDLMVIMLGLHQYKDLKAFHEMNPFFNEMEQPVFYALIGALMARDYDWAQSLATHLLELNSHFGEKVREDAFYHHVLTPYTADDMLNTTPGSSDMVDMVFQMTQPFWERSEYLQQLLVAILADPQVINEDNIITYDFREESVADSTFCDDFFEGLIHDYQSLQDQLTEKEKQTLAQYGFIDSVAFQNQTIDKFKAITGLNQQTVDKLQTNGVSFKEKSVTD